LITPAIIGDVRIGYSMEFNAGNNNKAVEVRFYCVSDAIEYGNNYQQTNNNLNWFTFSGFHYETLTGSSKTFSLQFRDTGGTICRVRNAEIEIWRVA
jgi:hypothetical protein